jgi:transposase
LKQRLKTPLAIEPAGLFDAVFEALAAMSPTAHLVQMFDSTIVRAHLSAAGAKGGKKTRRSDVRAEASRQKSISRPISTACQSPSIRPAAKLATAAISRRCSLSAQTLRRGRRLPTKSATRTDKRLAAGTFVQPFRIERTPS